MPGHDLVILPLTRFEFEPFGDVIELAGNPHFIINQGWAERYHDLARLELTAAGGRPLLNIFRASPRTLPLKIKVMERHALGSQTFIPLARARFVIVVAPAGAPRPSYLHAFVTDGVQGVNYRAGVWHHPLLVLDQVSDFVVLDRGASETDCEEAVFESEEITLRF